MPLRPLDPIIETTDLTIRFGGHGVVDHVNLRAEPFALKSIIGPNGAGKTTLFNLMTGQYKPTGGRVFLNNKDITDLSPAHHEPEIRTPSLFMDHPGATSPGWVRV